MHISEGVLSAPVLGAGWAAAGLGVSYGLWRMDYERVPRVAVLASAFFVASLVHVPIGPSSEHLILNGLTGLLLGWAAFPALLIALGLQAVFFSFGGPVVLGANVMTMATPAVVCYYAFHGRVRRGRSAGRVAAWGFAAGALSILLSALLAGVALVATDGKYLVPAGGLIAAHVPIMVVEGLVTAYVAAFLWKVRPELLDAPVWAPVRKEAADG